MVLFAPQKDVHLLGKVNAEFFRLSFEPLRLYQLDRDTRELDPDYGELADYDPRTGVAYDIPAWVKLEPLKAEWTKFGLREKRDLMVHYSVPLLDRGYLTEAGVLTPFPHPRRGDFIEVETDLYIIKDLFQRMYHGNQKEFLVLVAFGVIFRPSSMRGRELAILSNGIAPSVTETYKSHETDDQEPYPSYP